MPCHATSNHITTRMQTLNTNPKANPPTIKHSQANQTIMTHHMRHISMPVNQTNKKIIHLTQQFVKCNNSIPFNKMRLLQAK